MAFLDVPSPFECVCLCVSVCVSIYMCVCVCECPCVCKYRTPPPPPPTPPPHLINVFLTRTVIPRCRLECVKLRWAPTYFHHDIGDLSGFVCQNLCVPWHLRSPEEIFGTLLFWIKDKCQRDKKNHLYSQDY